MVAMFFLSFFLFSLEGVGWGEVQIYHESVDLDLLDVFQFMALPILIDAQTVPDLSSGSPFWLAVGSPEHSTIFD